TPGIQHADFSQVTNAHPAAVGETLQVYLTGLGALNSSGTTTESFTAAIDGVAASISFAGSASSVGGGYQMNIVVPTGIHSGPVYLDIAGPDSYNSEAVIPIPPGNGTKVVTGAAPRIRARATLLAKPGPKFRRRP